MDAETEFFTGMMELHHGLQIEQKLKLVAEKVSWARGWPENTTSFWNAEAFMWKHKISKEKRDLITRELGFLIGRKNLDLGCGTHSYILSAVGVDISEKMLLFNDNCQGKVVGNLEETLSFKKNSFDSVTAIFVLNYVQNYIGLLKEITRVLILEGVLVMVLSAAEINEWQKQKEVNSFTSKQWISVLEKTGFTVDFYEKEGLWFFKCCK
ncbi:class I SAM-dependent methyltransferase [Candidatus Woesearchaeota archaeon]|nr:class I SAM-dependent methyltransferase [Candidatus Woesearchaeota archaeon]